jgi:hypothetical protein
MPSEIEISFTADPQGNPGSGAKDRRRGYRDPEEGVPGVGCDGGLGFARGDV